MSKNTESLIERIKQREERGLSKYGTTLDRTDMPPEEWIQHAQDEALDLAAYLEGLKQRRFPRDEDGDRHLLQRCLAYFEKSMLDDRPKFREDKVRYELVFDIRARLDSEKRFTDDWTATLRDRRIAAGYGMRKFAMKIGMLPSSYCHIENGRWKPNEETKRLIENGLAELDAPEPNNAQTVTPEVRSV